MRNREKFLMVLFLTILLAGFSNKTLADSVEENTLKITAGNTVSEDINGYLSLVNFSGEVENGEWINHLEYDNTDNKGSSRLTFKVDKEFISNDDNYYDISIEYFDAGIGAVLLQSSLDENNSMNYPLTGYGAYL